MLELKRIYWTRQLLRLAMAALTVWIFAGAILSLVARSGNATAVRPPTTVTAIFTGMFDGVLAAVALPGVLAVVLTMIGPSSAAGTSGAATRSGASAASSAAKACRGQKASARWRLASAAVAPVLRNTATISTRGPRADPPACRTSPPRAAGAIARKARRSRRQASRKDWNDDGGRT